MRYITIASLILISVSATNAFATSYFVKNNGDDSADGISDATAWRTLSKVNSFSFAVGDDVYFKAGDTWNRKQLRIDWPGTSSDRAIVGAYYMNNGSVITSVPNGVNKPTIRGDYTTTTSRGNVPSEQYDGLIAIHANYVTVKNIKVQDSSGYGIINGASNSIIENNDVVHAIGALFHSYNGDNLIIRNNTMTQCNGYRTDNIAAYGGGGHPACLALQHSNYSLVENNTLHDLRGEGIDLMHDSNYNTVRGNLITKFSNPGIYLDKSSDNIIENNTILGHGNGSYSSEAIASVVEIYGTITNNANNIIRNNLISGTRSCLYTEVWTDNTTVGKYTSGQFIGNTCIGVKNGIIFLNGADRYGTWEVANNIFWDIDTGTSSCSAPNDTDISFHHNSWNTNLADADCNGTGDIHGNPNLKTSTDFRLFSITNRPTVSDIEPQAGSPVISAGATLASLTQDYSGKTRQSAPTIGALEAGNSTSNLNTPSGLSLTILR